MDAPTAPPTLYASLLAFAMGASLATRYACVLCVAMGAFVSATLSATAFGIAVLAHCG